MADPCFTIKGTSLTTMVLDLYHYSPDEFTRQLQDKIATAPDFFRSSPIYIDVSAFDGALNANELNQLLGALREHALEPIGCKGADEATAAALEQAGLARLPASRARKTVLEPEPAEPVVQAAHKPSKIVDRPVRSGQQVYAEGADLILLAPVSEGAEVMADGHIHVYSALRGRALAGVRDDITARIFCQKMEAELVSIAGQFIMNETLRERCWKQPAQVYWEDESIHVSALT